MGLKGVAEDAEALVGPYPTRGEMVTGEPRGLYGGIPIGCKPIVGGSCRPMAMGAGC